jgi:cell division protein ZapA (FtsZ GTPase activity inhibitor)
VGFGKAESRALEQMVTIKLFGQPYTFKAESEVKAAKAVAELLVREVDKVQNQQSGQLPNISNLTILMLAALNIANENIELKRNHSKLLDDVNQRSARIIGQLNEFVPQAQ